MKKYTTIGAVMTLILVFTFTMLGASYADEMSEEEVSKPTIEERQEMRSAIHEAISNGDYDTWYSLVSESPRGAKILEIINESNWDQFVEAHQLIEEGRAKMQEAHSIMEELGLPKPPKPKQ
ncbi:hypothetical protein KJ742_03285 [Patescibacteria group bacterium]|nr:hypothetical protein [Patescibacteria group bacterium]MBU1682944.1 hypothetical protein [Patescibacteria group bacterium]MBU1935689.1 hypothetical protein [Patescibacteria group bacterium]